MIKRFLLVAPLALALGACGSSTDSAPDAPPSTPAGAPTAPAAQDAPDTAASTARTDDTPAAAGSAAPSAADDASSSAPAASTAPADDSAAVAAARAQAAKDFVDDGTWVEGKNYYVIQPAQPKVTGTDKVEVVEVFSFGCPACNHAHKLVDKMRAALPSYATMAYLPAGFRPDENWTVYQRAWYAAKALGVAEKSYDTLFETTWDSGETATYDLGTGRPKPKSQWPDINDIAQVYASKFDVPAKDFAAVAESFTINTKMKRADELVKSYGVTGTPSFVVDGKYRFDFRSAGGYTQAIDLAKWLAAKEAAGK